MPRATNAPAACRRHKKILRLASGYKNTRSRWYKIAFQAVQHAGVYAYRDRRVRKREFRQLWIARINAATRACGMSYSTFIRGLKNANIDLNRKMLAEIAATDEVGFQQLVEIAKANLANSGA